MHNIIVLDCIGLYCVCCVIVCHKYGNLENNDLHGIYYLVERALSSNAHDDHDCDADLDSDMLDCCCFSRYPHSVLTLVVHGHALNPMSIYY